MITSTKNEKVKQIKALQGRAKARREAGAFVIEGIRLAEEALHGHLRVRHEGGQALRRAADRPVRCSQPIGSELQRHSAPDGVLHRYLLLGVHLHVLSSGSTLREEHRVGRSLMHSEIHTLGTVGRTSWAKTGPR